MGDPFYYDKLNTFHQVYYRTLAPHTTPYAQHLQITTPLYPHQVTMIQEMNAYRERMIHGIGLDQRAIYGKMGIIGDPPGSGKTLTVLAYLASLSSFPHVNNLSCELTPHSSRFFYSHDTYSVNAVSANLIIVPHSLFQEWKNEIQKHTTLSYVALETRRMLRGTHVAKEMTTRSFVLTTNRCYRYVQEYAQEHHISWNHIIIDEATSIYMSSSDPPLRFQFLWLMAHQWPSLLFKNASFHRGKMYSMRDHMVLHPELERWLSDSPSCTHYEGTLVSSGFFREYVPFYHPNRYMTVLRNSEEWIRTTLALPPPTNEIIYCRPNITFQSLMGYYLMRKMDPTIHPSRIPHLFQSLGIAFQPLSAYLPLCPPSKHGMIQGKVMDNECVICLERCVYPTMIDCCYHLYCGTCLLKNTLLNRKCPTCREPVVPSRMVCFETLPETQPVVFRGKSETCLELIRTHPTGRFLIYSAFDNIYYQLFEEIDRLGRKAERIENNLFSLLKTVRNFKQGVSQIVFVSNIDLLRGLSFPFVTHLIFYHEQPAYEKKTLLIQSAQRVGRTEPLRILHLHSEIQV